MLHLGIFGLDFEKNIGIFEINILEFVLLQNLERKKSPLNLRPKMPDLSFIGQDF